MLDLISVFRTYQNHSLEMQFNPSFYGYFFQVVSSLQDYSSHFKMYMKTSGFGGLVVSMLASGTQDRGFDPGRSRRIFRAK